MTYFDVLNGNPDDPDNPPLPSAAEGLTQVHVARLRTILESGDRGGFYLAYYELLKQIDPSLSGITGISVTVHSIVCLQQHESVRPAL